MRFFLEVFKNHEGGDEEEKGQRICVCYIAVEWPCWGEEDNKMTGKSKETNMADVHFFNCLVLVTFKDYLLHHIEYF